MKQSTIDLGLAPEVAFLIDAARSSPSADNSQPWLFEWDGVNLTGRVNRRGGFPIDYHATSLALGACAQNLLMAMQSIGIPASEWFLGPPGDDGVFARGPVVLRVPCPAFPPEPAWKRRHTSRVPYLPDDDGRLSHALTVPPVGAVQALRAADATVGLLADLVRQASEIRFRTREVNEWFAASLRYGEDPRDHTEGLHVDTLALPPGGISLLRLISDWRRLRWLNRVGAYKVFAAIEAASFRKAPMVFAIVGPADRACAFDAGRLLQALWLAATDLGLAAQPYYVVSDLLHRLQTGGVPDDCADQAGALQDRVHVMYGNDTTLHCLLRVGRPVRRTAVSGRLPLESITRLPEQRS